MKRYKMKGSYTLEAAIYIPMIIFLLFQSIQMGIDYWMNSREREINEVLRDLDVVQEFYGYQILEEIGKELEDDKS